MPRLGMPLSLLFLLAGCGAAPTAKAPVVPLYAQDRYVDGIVAMHKQDFPAAETAAREALKEAPDFVDAHLLLAESLFRQGQEADGIAVLDDVDRLAPGRPEPLLLRGMLTELRGELPKAQEFYRQARASYDTGTMTREQALNYAIASYLAAGRLAGFQAVDDLLEKTPEDQELRVLRSQISQDQRAFFLQRVKPENGKPENARPAPADRGEQ